MLVGIPGNPKPLADIARGSLFLPSKADQIDLPSCMHMQLSSCLAIAYQPNRVFRQKLATSV